MFTDKQVAYMKSIGLFVNFEHPTDDEWVLIEDKIGDRLTGQELDADYNPTPNGVICESILDLLP